MPQSFRPNLFAKVAVAEIAINIIYSSSGDTARLGSIGRSGNSPLQGLSPCSCSNRTGRALSHFAVSPLKTLRKAALVLRGLRLARMARLAKLIRMPLLAELANLISGTLAV